MDKEERELETTQENVLNESADKMMRVAARNDSGESQYIFADEKGRVGGLVEVRPLIEEVERTVRSGASLKIFPSDYMVDYAEYNISVSVKGGDSLKKDDIIVRTYWATQRNYALEDDYGGVVTTYDEELMEPRLGNFLTKRTAPKSHRLNQVRIINKSNRDLTLVVQFYRYSTMSSPNIYIPDINIPDTNVEVKTQYIENQRYVAIKANDPDYSEVFTTNAPCYVQSLFIKLNRPSPLLDIRIRDGEGKGYIRDDEGNWISLEFVKSMGGEDDLFKVTEYNEDDDLYVMILKNPIYCPYGFNIVLPNLDGLEAFARISVVYFNEVD